MKHIFTLFGTVFFLLLSSIVFSQVTVTSSDSINCTNHCTVLTAHLVGDVPLNSGITIDDIFETTPDPIGFTFDFYGAPYTSCLIGPNGNICFNTSLAGLFTDWTISAALLGNPTVFNTICGPWEDIDIVFGGNITYSTDGLAPNRKYVITYCATHMFWCTTQFTTSQIILYETSNIIEVHLTHKDICTGWNPSGGTGGGRGIIGVQNATGTVATVAPGRDWEPIWSATDEAWRFTPISGGTDYAVSSIPYAPIPYDTSTIYWYNATTGAYLGTGLTKTVCTDSRTTYKAGALGCADTSFGYYTVNPTGNLEPMTYSFTNPTQCGIANGTITLHERGILVGLSDTIRYELGGVAQPYIVTTDSNYTITGLCAGVYSNFTFTQGACTSPPAGPITLTTPPIIITGVTTTNPTLCGSATGTITLNGLAPSTAFTITYDYNGVAQPAVFITSSTSGTVVLTGLCAGIYTNIIASYTSCGTCTTAPVGPFTLTNPPISISSLSFVDPNSWCIPNGSITLYGLYPGQTYTITYNMAGVAQPPLILTADGSGTITITGLNGAGGIIYSNFVATFTNCSSCTTPPAGPLTLTATPPPPVTLDGTPKNPTQCGYCDGVITLKSVTPYSSDTISYSLNGVLQPTFETYANPDSSITLGGLCEGTYSGISVKAGNCLVGVTGTVTLIAPKLIPYFSDVIHPGCHGDTVMFTNETTSPNATLPVVMHNKWNFGDSTTDSLFNPEHIYPQGTFTVTLTVSNRFCVADTSFSVTLFHPLKAGFSPSPDILCQNNPVVFTDTSTGIISSYQWLFGNGATSNGINATYTYKNTGVYNAMLIVGNTVPCWDTAMAIIQVDSQSSVKLELTDSVLCRSTDINFTGVYTTSGNIGITWNFGDGDSVQNMNPVVRSYDATGVFTVTANAYFRKCRDTSGTKVVHVYPQPVINLGPGDTTICKGSNPLILADKINKGNPAASWKWSTGETGPQITVIAPGIYTSTVMLYGCTSSFTVDVANDCYINIPNVFSPNGDGVNDYFFPRTLLTAGLISFNMNVYNRWGELIFQSSSLDGRGWDGRFNNVDQPEGVYVYMIDAEFKDGQKEHHQGNVTLIR